VRHAEHDQRGGKAVECWQEFHATIDGPAMGASQARSRAVLEMLDAKFAGNALLDQRALRDFFDSKDTAFGSKAFGS
jgi:hypothetical protein